MRHLATALILVAWLFGHSVSAVAQDDAADLSERPSWALTDWMAHDTTRKTQEAYRYHSYGEFDEAFDRYMVAASRGYPEAQLNIGNYYATGPAPKAPTDKVEAVKWYLLSGIGVGEHYAELLREQMTDDEWAEAERRAADWKPATD